MSSANPYTNPNAASFPHSYHVRSRLMVNGARQWFPPAVETYLRQQNAMETAVLAVLRTDSALSRSDIIAACRDYLLEQADPDSPAADPGPVTDDAIAMIILRLVNMGIAELVVIRQPALSASTQIPPAPGEPDKTDKANRSDSTGTTDKLDSTGRTSTTGKLDGTTGKLDSADKDSRTSILTTPLFSSETVGASTPLNGQQLCFPWESS
jgi:hypothetical protein